MSVTASRNLSQPPKEFVEDPDFARVNRTVRPAPPRYRNELGKYSVHRSAKCESCGQCVVTCEHGVHVRPRPYQLMTRPFDYRCIGPDCEATGNACTQKCPNGALKVMENPAFKTLGDFRWTADLLARLVRPQRPQIQILSVGTDEINLKPQ